MFSPPDPDHSDPTHQYPFAIKRTRSGDKIEARNISCKIFETCAERPGVTPEGIAGLPWITPVLGTGALEVPDGWAFTSEAFVAGVRQGVKRRWVQDSVPWHELKLGSTYGTRNPLSYVGGSSSASDDSFPRSLYEDRLFGTQETGPTAEFEIPDLGIDLVLLAAVITELYQSARTGRTAVGRWWGQETAETKDNEFKDVVEICTRLCEFIRDGLNDQKRPKYRLPEIQRLGNHTEIDGTLHPNPLTTHLDLLLEDVNRTLLLGKLPLASVRYITEIAWVVASSETMLYPGWSDILLLLAMLRAEHHGLGYRAIWPDHSEQERGVIGHLRDLLANPTVRSWKTRLPENQSSAAPRESKRDGLYDQVAQLLSSEARLGRKVSQVAPEKKRQICGPKAADLGPPAPTAIVTSFDLELPMAFLQAGSAFQIVMPIELIDQPSLSGQLLWVAIHFNERAKGEALSNETLVDLTKPTVEQFRRAQPTSGQERLPNNIPTIIYLNGCPLIRLPADDKGLEGHALIAKLQLATLMSNPRFIQPAVVIDDYSSVRHSEHALFFETTGRPRGLPSDLIADVSFSARFYLGLGVQLDDPAVRFRLFSQLSVGQLKSQGLPNSLASSQREEPKTLDIFRTEVSGSESADSSTIGPRSEPESTDHDAQQTPAEVPIRGIAVNARLDQDEADLIQWQGFELVKGHCADIGEAIGHWVHHLEHIEDQLAGGSYDWRRATGGQCQLGRKR